MAFAMRMELNSEIIKEDSVKSMYINGAKNGFEFDVQLAYYRGHYLSDIDWISATTDWSTVKKDLAVSGAKIKLGVNGEEKEFDKGIGTHANSEIV